ncbi:hypothetical protein [Zooshikella sp. RANM57]|uniref:hypothetical protein n=1 Tax=Zooshikella sp. RANM57 TaxID=3425863 RepID=UPI003D70065B
MVVRLALFMGLMLVTGLTHADWQVARLVPDQQKVVIYQTNTLQNQPAGYLSACEYYLYIPIPGRKIVVIQDWRQEQTGYVPSNFIQPLLTLPEPAQRQFISALLQQEEQNINQHQDIIPGHPECQSHHLQRMDPALPFMVDYFCHHYQPDLMRYFLSVMSRLEAENPQAMIHGLAIQTLYQCRPTFTDIHLNVAYQNLKHYISP